MYTHLRSLHHAKEILRHGCFLPPREIESASESAGAGGGVAKYDGLVHVEGVAAALLEVCVGGWGQGDGDDAERVTVPGIWGGGEGGVRREGERPGSEVRGEVRGSAVRGGEGHCTSIGHNRR